MKKVFKYIKENIVFLLLVVIIILLLILFRTCNNNNEYKKEIDRLENNILAKDDTLKNWKAGIYSIAEMRALQLKISELSDSLEYEKNRPPITIIRYVVSIKDSIVTKPIIYHDTINNFMFDEGEAYITDYKEFGKSSRNLKINIPYCIDSNNLLTTGDAEIFLTQNIWTEAQLLQDKKYKDCIKVYIIWRAYKRI